MHLSQLSCYLALTAAALHLLACLVVALRRRPEPHITLALSITSIPSPDRCGAA